MNCSLFKKVTDKTNIYNSICALESYIFEKGLLSPEDLAKYNLLSDKFNFELIDKTISVCQKDIINILTNPTKLFDIEVFFKFKKFDDNEDAVFRPLHTASLNHQICMVAMLNVIMFNDDFTKPTRKLSDIARLLPANFFGNIPSTNPNEVFVNWKVKYKEFSEMVIYRYYEYKSNNKYTQEVCLDLKDFFPSVNPLHIFNLIYDKLEPSFSVQEDKECLKIILQKLLYFNIKPFDRSWQVHYYPNIESTILIKNEKNLINRGLPQGLPHAYFFSNLCMVEVAKQTQKVFKGDALYYVDDSVIYTKDINEGTFSEKIEELNASMQTYFEQEYEQITLHELKCLDSKKLDFNKHIKYKIEIHPNDKSSISSIDKAYNDLSKLQNLATQISGVASIFSTLDETEDSNLKKKLEVLVNAINKELDNVKAHEKNKIDKAYKYKQKLLLRYKKFFLFRLRLLDYNEKAITEEDFNSFYEKYGLSDNKTELDKNTFFNNYEEDIFIAEVRLIIQYYEGNDQSLASFKDSIRSIEEKLLAKEPITDGRKKNLYIRKDIEGTTGMLTVEDLKYESLGKIMGATYRYLPKTISANKTDKLLEILNSDISVQFINESYTKFIFTLSDEYKRKILNALFSYVFGIGISNSYTFAKSNNRPIQYFELRLICYLRNKHFNFNEFTTFANTILNGTKDDKTPEKVDPKIFEALHIFITRVKQPNYIDSLISVHKLVNGLWKNGSKFLHFYTLHNEEHAIELIQQSLKLTRAIDYFRLKDIDFYLLFLACYLHDISMVVHPNLESFTSDSNASDSIYTEFIQEKLSTNKVDTKALLVNYFKKIFSYFENNVRDTHPKESAQFIIKTKDTYLSFIEKTHLQIVADVSAAHGIEAYEVYGRKSKGATDIFSVKYLMILLRLADLLDMSKDRVSYYILKENIRHMEPKSQFHWISHLITDKSEVKVDYKLKTSIESTLEKNAIDEIININIHLNTKQFTKTKSPSLCRGFSATKNDNEIVIEILDNNTIECSNKNNCLFTCKWMQNKQYYLFKELLDLKKYLKRVNNGIFETQIFVNIICDDKIDLDTEFRDIVSSYLEKLWNE